MKRGMTMATVTLAALPMLLVPATATARDDDDHDGGNYGGTYERHSYYSQDRERGQVRPDYGYQNNPFYNDGRYDGGNYTYQGSRNGYRDNPFYHSGRPYDDRYYGSGDRYRDRDGDRDRDGYRESRERWRCDRGRYWHRDGDRAWGQDGGTR